MIKLNNVEKYLNELRNEKEWTGSVLISQDNEVLYENNIMVTSNAKYCIASLTKSFTGLLILQLIQENKLKLNSTLNELLPQLVNIQDTTISELLTHTSGIQSIFNDEKFQSCMKNNTSVSEIIQAFEKIKIDPNDRGEFNYINFDYMLLKEVIEVVTGVSYESHLQSTILYPLGMINTGCLTHQNENVGLLPNYMTKGDIIEEVNDIPYNSFAGAGNLYSTVGDLNMFLNALLNHKLLNKENTRHALQNQNKAYDDWYVTLFNFSKQVSKGHQIYFHEGGLAGFRSSYLFDPQNDLIITILSNVDFVDIEEMTLRVHQLMQKDLS